MTVPFSSAAAAGGVGTGRTAPTPNLDAQSSLAVGAVWQSVFDRARDDAHPPHAGNPQDRAGYRPTRTGDGIAGLHRHVRLGEGLAIGAWAGHAVDNGAAPHTAAGLLSYPPTPSADSADGAASHPHSDIATPHLQGPRGIPNRVGPQPERERPVSRAAARPGGAMEPSAAPAASQTASDDCVSVFVQGSVVSIVVRDAGVSDEDAVHSAFATARELTGRGTALKQLTLNGRLLYQRGVVADDPTPFPATFAC